MLTIRLVSPDGARRLDRTELEDARAALGEGTFVWVDIGAPIDDDVAVLDLLDLPALVVEDMRDDRHLPKVELLPGTLSLTVHGLDVTSLGTEARTTEVDVALERDLLVTFHVGRLASVEVVGDRLDEGVIGFSRPFELLHRVLDVMNDVFLPFLDHLDNRLDVIEEDILDEPTEATRRDLYALQRDVIQLRRIVVPQAEVIRRLARERPPGWVTGDDAMVRDLVDHLDRMVTLSDSYHQLLSSAMDSYRGALDDRLNEMLTTLTIVSALLLPVSVVAGLWGMNFVVVPGTGETDGFWWLLGGCAVLVWSMTVWFWSRGWIGRRAERRAEGRRRGLAVALDVPLLGTVLRVPVSSTRVVGRALRRAATVARSGDD